MDMNTQLGKKSKNDFGKDFLRLMNNTIEQWTIQLNNNEQFSEKCSCNMWETFEKSSL